MLNKCVNVSTNHVPSSQLRTGCEVMCPTALCSRLVHSANLYTTGMAIQPITRLTRTGMRHRNNLSHAPLGKVSTDINGPVLTSICGSFITTLYGLKPASFACKDKSAVSNLLPQNTSMLPEACISSPQSAVASYVRSTATNYSPVPPN